MAMTIMIYHRLRNMPTSIVRSISISLPLQEIHVSAFSTNTYTYTHNYNCRYKHNYRYQHPSARIHRNRIPKATGQRLLASFVPPPEISTHDGDAHNDINLDAHHDVNADSHVGFDLDVTRQELLLKDLNPSQIEAVTQPLFDQDEQPHDPRAIVTRVIAGPGSGKTKVLTTRIAHLLQQDPYGKILAVTFTRKAAGEMKERLERLLVEQEEALFGTEGESENDTPHHHSSANHNIVQEDGRTGTVDASQSTNPRGIERVELGTFHSICAKILRYNGELLRDLPSVQRDMSKAQPPDNAEINLNGQYAIIDQTEQIRTLNECLKEQEIDLKQTDLKPMQILTAISKMKESFAQGHDPFVDARQQNGMPGRPGAALRTARKVYYPYREKLLSQNALDFDDLILLTRELLTHDDELRRRLHQRWPHVLVDEYQDTSKIQMDLIKLLTSASLFVVGDADQSIYSWRGAHVGSLEEVATEFSEHGSVRTVFLKENYRSTSNIVRAAEKVISSGHGETEKLPSVLQEALAEAGLDADDAELRSQLQNMDPSNSGPSSTPGEDLRRAMKPKRGSGPSPRVVACEDERAEAKFVVDTILNMTAHGDIGRGDTVAMIYRTNAQSRYLEEACVQQNLPYVIRGGAGGFYKRAEIRDCLCFLKWLANGNDEGSMVRAMKTPSKGIGEKAFQEFQAYCETVQTFVRQNCPDRSRPTSLDVLISMTSDDADAVGEYALPAGAPVPQDHISKRALNNFLKFSTKMKLIRSRAYTDPIGKLLLFLIEELELMGHFDAISKSRTEFLERQENVQELRNAAKKYASYGPCLTQPGDAAASKPELDPDEVLGVDSALSTFLDDVALVSDIAEANQEGEDKDRMVVNLMTIHASKGTEFDCVFVVGVEEGTLPCQPALQEGPGSVQLEEEKRLCYVAMTRAKTRLILTWRKEVTSFSNWSDSGPKTQTKQRSRFLNAIVSKKSRKKNARLKKKKKPPVTNQGSPASGVRRASTYAGASQSRTRLNRSGLTGSAGNRRRVSEPGRSRRDARQQSTANTAPPPRRPSAATTRRKPPNNQRQQIPNATTQNLEGIEALRSSLGAPPPSSRVAGGSPRKRSASAPPPRRRSPSKTTVGKKPSPRRSSSQPPPKDMVDPTWFFPVGKKVVHMNLGKGTVVDPPPFSKVEDAKVRVRFDNGKTMEFPALGSDILPDMGNF